MEPALNVKIKSEVVEDFIEDKSEIVKVKEEIESENQSGFNFIALPTNSDVKLELCHKTELKQENEIADTNVGCKAEVKEEQMEVETVDTGDKVTKLKKPKPKNTEVECKECGIICRDRKTYRLHVMDHTGRPFKCDQCDKSYKNSTDLLYHKKSHTGDHDIHCEYCHKGFTVKSALRAHMRTHSKEKPFVCPICDKGFSHSSSLKPHIIMHTNELTYNCDQCEMKFKSSKSLKTHKRAAHTPGGYKGEQCPHCPKLYKSKEGLRMHLVKHRPSSEPQKPKSPTPASKIPMFTCEECGKSYTRLGTLKTHLRIHNGTKFTCQTCGKSFIRKMLLDIHMRNHTGETPYSCDLCDRKFKRKDTLLYHKTTHDEGRRVFQCDMCDKVLVCKSTWRVHRKYFHSSERRHQCSYCLQLFKLRYDLTRHLRKHKEQEETEAESLKIEQTLVKQEVNDEESEDGKYCKVEKSGGFESDQDVVKVFKHDSLFDNECEIKKPKEEGCVLLTTGISMCDGVEGDAMKHIKDEIIVKAETNCEES